MMKRQLLQYVRIFLFTALIYLLISQSGVTAQSNSQISKGGGPSSLSSAPAIQEPESSSLVFLPMVSTASMDLAISDVKIIQGTSAGEYPVNIADRPTIVRVFVSVSNGNGVSGVTGRMYVYSNSGESQGSLDSNSITAPSTEGSMARTLDFDLPLNWVRPGYSFYVDVNPDGSIAENRSNDRYPASGTAPFDFVAVRPLDVVIVPIFYLPYGASQQTVPAGYNFSNPQESDFAYLTAMVSKVLPIPSVHYQIHAPQFYVPASADDNLNDPYGDGWYNLLLNVTSVHDSEDPYPYDTVYFGVVNYVDAHGCELGCTIGMGWVGWNPVSVGWTGSFNGASDATNTMTHEIGHNFGRKHTPCAGESDPDWNYPYSGGSIGVWGLDVGSATLYDPTKYKDYMSYCGPVWTSDYTFAGIKTYRDSASYDRVQAAGQPVPGLYVSGVIGADGKTRLRPVYQQNALINAPAQGTHTLEALGDKGQVLAEFPFTPTEIGDTKGAKGFAIYIPVIDGLDGLRVKSGNTSLTEKIVSLPMAAAQFAAQPFTVERRAQGTAYKWTPVSHPTAQVVYRIRLSRDGGATWQVLAVDWRATELTVPPGWDTGNALVEIQASDGIHTTTRTFPVTGP